MKYKTVKIIAQDELEAMHTGSLLSRLQRLGECDESFETSDLPKDELQHVNTDEYILFKASADWKTALDEVKIVSRKTKNMK